MPYRSKPYGVFYQNLMMLTKSENATVALRSTIALCGGCVCLITTSVMLRYAQEVIRTGDFAPLSRTEMAPHTAICLFCMGLAAICGALLWRMQHHE